MRESNESGMIVVAPVERECHVTVEQMLRVIDVCVTIGVVAPVQVSPFDLAKSQVDWPQVVAPSASVHERQVAQNRHLSCHRPGHRRRTRRRGGRCRGGGRSADDSGGDGPPPSSCPDFLDSRTSRSSLEVPNCLTLPVGCHG